MYLYLIPISPAIQEVAFSSDGIEAVFFILLVVVPVVTFLVFNKRRKDKNK